MAEFRSAERQKWGQGEEGKKGGMGLLPFLSSKAKRFIKGANCKTPTPGEFLESAV